MIPHRLKSTTRRLAAMLAMLVFIAAQAAAAMCDCRLQASADLAVSASVAIDSCCARHAPRATRAGDGCDSSPASAPADDECPGCACSNPLPPATLSASATADLDSPNTLLSTALLPTPTSLDLSSAVSMAFDLIHPGSPPGLRLHALLCVWRN